MPIMHRLLLSLVLGCGLALAADAAAVPVGLVWDERFKLHDTGRGHPERAERLDAIRAGLDEAGLLPLLTTIAPVEAEDRWLELAHPASYLAQVRRAIADGAAALPTGDTQVSAASERTARLAAGGVLAACDAVMAGTIRRAFCAVRPPGHHATRDRGMGFCIYANVAIAARYLAERHGLQRILVIDWDVHHGNGTYDVLRADPRVFQFHLQQMPLYPGTGDPAERGEGPAAGQTINVPLAAGQGEAEMQAAIAGRLLPEMDRWKPEFVLISCGFDAHRDDPLGGLTLVDASYARLTQAIIAIAERHASGRIVSVLEGGYDLAALKGSAAAHVGALLGRP